MPYNGPEVPGFPHFHVDEEDSKAHYRCDISLFLLTFVITIAYAGYTASQYLDPLTYTSTCYSAQLGGASIKVKQLCYTAETLDGFSNADKAKALHTFTCRSSFGGERWGVIIDPSKTKFKPQRQLNTCANPKKPDGQQCTQPCDCQSNGCNQDKKCTTSGGGTGGGGSGGSGGGGSGGGGSGGSGGSGGGGGGSGGGGVSAKLSIRSLVNQWKFCQLVVNFLDDELVPFSTNTKTTDGGVITDTSKGYTFLEDGYEVSEDDPASTENQAEYYKITGYQDTTSTLTCCGNRLTSTDERLLNWLGTVGGFAGLVHAFFFMLSNTEFFGTLCGRKKELEDNYNNNGDVEMTNSSENLAAKVAQIQKRLATIEARGVTF